MMYLTVFVPCAVALDDEYMPDSQSDSGKGLDTTFSYQYVINPALTREIDRASVFSLRIRAVF
jgi:hypothetical protein